MDTPLTAKEAINLMGHKTLFEYIPEMEISVPDTDRRNSLDKIAFYFRDEEIVLSDLYIGYAISLYRYTIPPVIADTMRSLGKMWPNKNVPRHIDRENLRSRIKKMCGMGMLRRFVYKQKESEGNVVLYSTTAEFAKIIYQALKLNTDARSDKDIIPPIEIIEKAAASLISNELLKSTNVVDFNFMPEFRDESGKICFYSRLHHVVNQQDYITIVEPIFTKIDKKRFTANEWEQHVKRKIKALYGYMSMLSESMEKTTAQIIIVCEDVGDFQNVSKLVCTIFPESFLSHVFFTGEGTLKCCNYDLSKALLHITAVKMSGQDKVPKEASAALPYNFF